MYALIGIATLFLLSFFVGVLIGFVFYAIESGSDNKANK